MRSKVFPDYACMHVSNLLSRRRARSPHRPDDFAGWIGFVRRRQRLKW